MLVSRKVTLSLFLLILISFVYGLVHLFLLRFESGDMYPPYSSLRSDPLGTRVLYESITNLNPSSVKRNFLPFSQVQFKEPTTVFYLGGHISDSESVPKEFANTVDKLTENGGRLVMSFLPVNKKPNAALKCGKSNDEKEFADKENQKAEIETRQAESSEGESTGSNSERIETKDDSSQEFDDSALYHKTVSLKERWGISFEYDDGNDPLSKAHLADEHEKDGLPDSISWHSIIYFDSPQEPWKVIYRRNGHPVLVERPYKQGTILLAADSFLFSNEALRSERYPDLLTRVIGPRFQTMFDESHFGIYKVPGIAGLIRTYRFHWFFLTLVLLFILLVWKNSAYFVPPLDDNDGDTSDAGSGKDYTQGLTSLLRRNIAVKDTLRLSLEEWKKSFLSKGSPKSEKILEILNVIEMEEALSDYKANPVKGYNMIRKTLSEGNSK